eukprot:jgi/Undpi1/2975/HiC_scaffold_14.g06352.m1
MFPHQIRLCAPQGGAVTKAGDGALRSTQGLGKGLGSAKGAQGPTSPSKEASTVAATGLARLSPSPVLCLDPESTSGLRRQPSLQLPPVEHRGVFGRSFTCRRLLVVLPLAEIRVFPAPWAALSFTVVALYAIGVILAGGAEEGVAGGGAISGLDDGVEGVTGDGTFSDSSVKRMSPAMTPSVESTVRKQVLQSMAPSPELGVASEFLQAMTPSPASTVSRKA